MQQQITQLQFVLQNFPLNFIFVLGLKHKLNQTSQTAEQLQQALNQQKNQTLQTEQQLQLSMANCGNLYNETKNLEQQITHQNQKIHAMEKNKIEMSQDLHKKTESYQDLQMKFEEVKRK